MWRVSRRGFKRKDQHTLPVIRQFFHLFLVTFHLFLELNTFPLSSAFLFSSSCIQRPHGSLPLLFSPDKTASQWNCISVHYFRMVGECFIYHIRTRAVADSGRDGAQYVNRRAKVMASHNHTKNVCVNPLNAPIS